MVKVLHVNPVSPENDVIEEAVYMVEEGRSIVYPTDTVYGLGTNALNSEAVGRLFQIKGRHPDQPFPVAVAGLEMVEELAFVDEKARSLIEAFWPGALTLVLRRREVIPPIVVAGGKTVGVRMPNHVVPLRIMEVSNLPLVATSANLHGLVSPLDAVEAEKQIGDKVDLILDGGRVSGVPSTILDLAGEVPKIIRSGSVTREMLVKVIGFVD